MISESGPEYVTDVCDGGVRSNTAVARRKYTRYAVICVVYETFRPVQLVTTLLRPTIVFGANSS